ncbi:MAG: PP2C family protein-serine/threonine phosphatase [Candidatus Eisenbacteria bacterium]
MSDVPGIAIPPADPKLLVAALRLLTELGGVVASTTQLTPVLETVVQKSTALLGADEGSIKLMDAGETGARTVVRKNRDLGFGSWPQAITMSVMGYLLAKRKPVVTADLLDDPEFGGLRNVESHVRATLAVPLIVENRVTGFLAVTNRTPGRRWTPDEVQLMGIVAQNSAVMIEQARLRAEAEEKRRFEEENKRLEGELVLAREIQMGLVPSTPMTFGPWDVQGQVVPARQVGGDYFDYFPLGEDRIGVAIADVSGKGVPAALLMSNLEATLRAYGTGDRPIPEMIRAVNMRMSLTSSAGKFITLFYAEIDRAAEVIRFTNAGHNYPLLRRADGTLEELKAGGLLLGLFSDAKYEMGEVPFGPGDALLMYSDGISEAFDERGDQYGEVRLMELWTSLASSTAAEAVTRLFAELERFRGRAPQSDDMTVVMISPRRDR